MINRLFPKLYRLPSTLRQKIYPSANRLLFSCMGIRFGKNMNVLGRISVIGWGKITIGDNFYFSSGDAVNPISSNLQGVFYTESGG